MAYQLPDSQVIRCAPPSPALSYERHPSPGRVFARFGDEETLPLDRGRERHYPGLSAEAPPTVPLYERALVELGPLDRVLDAGCGAGAGSAFLARHCREVIGIDRSPEAVRFARRFAPGAKIIAGDLSFPQAVGTVDGAVVIDVLGQAVMPEEVLTSLRSVLPTGRQLFIAEAQASGSQYLRAPVRRAFSRCSLTTLLTVTGYEVTRWADTEGPFLACVVTARLDEGWDHLRNGYSELAAGDVEDALASFTRASQGERPAIRLEAALGTAECHLSRRAGDQAIAAYFRAREISESDPRPMAGLARIALAMGDVTDAEQLVAMALRSDPTDVATMCAHALVSERVSPGRSKGPWLAAANLAPESLDIALHLAQAAAHEGDYGLAVWALERVRNYGDDHGVAMHVAMASALLGAGRVADALLEAHLAEALAPFDDAVKALKAQLAAAHSQ